jgi:hypothetical protein
VEVEDAEVEVDAAADVAAGVNIIRNQFIHPPIQGPLFEDCVGCPPAMDRYKFRVIL